MWEPTRGSLALVAHCSYDFANEEKQVLDNPKSSQILSLQLQQHLAFARLLAMIELEWALEQQSQPLEAAN